MKFQITPEAKQLILKRGCQIRVSLETEECYACCGQRKTKYLSARLGKPEAVDVDKYEVILQDSIKVFVQNKLYDFDSSAVLAIDIADLLSETLAIYGVATN